MYDMIIIGGGPAGLTAALYAGRAGLSCLVLEKMFCGGQMLKTAEIDNFPGAPNIQDTYTFAETLKEQALSFGATFQTEEVIGLSYENGVKTVTTSAGSYQAKTLILATGAKPKPLGIPGEAAFTGRGVSYCATCDGAFFRKKTVAVIGGGDTALEDAIYLSALCETVYLIHRRDTFRAADILVQRAKSIDNIQFVRNTTAEEIIGEHVVSSLSLSTGDILPVSGVFIAVGTMPETALFSGFVDMDKNGAVLTNEHLETNIPGVFAAGDLRKKALRQIITACADGAKSVHYAQRYLMENA